MMTVAKYRTELSSSPPRRLKKKILKSALKKKESLSYRYPVTGSLNITDYKEYLEICQNFFTAHYGHLSHDKVKVEDFKLSYELGRGTFGYVVLANHISTDINYAIKVIPKDKLLKLSSVKQTLDERNILLGLNNPFTIYLTYFMMDNSFLYFVLPYIEGGELFEYLNLYGRFKEEQAQFYISQVILGLEYLHHLDLIYRDLKPENILVDHTGYLKLVDFGFSKILQKSSRTYTLCGTPEYMAPEIILNKGHGTPADWWATGVLLYELVSGYTPFHHTNKMRTFEKIVTNSYEMSDRFSSALKDLIQNLLQHDATQRFGNLKRGVNDIKQHKWFRTTNWMAILNRKITPKFIPISDKNTLKEAVCLTVDSEDKFKELFKEFVENES